MPDSSGPSSHRRVGAYIALTAALIVALVVMNLLVLAANNPNRLLGPHFYVATGDSISFGFQPDLSFYHGFADDLAQQLQQEEITNKQTGKPAVEINLTNYACPGETTSTMIDGNCQFRNLIKTPYVCPAQSTCSQLDAVVNFLAEHKGNVSPVTFELGANDLLPDFDSKTCGIRQGVNVDGDLTTMDTNLTKVDASNPDDAGNPNNGILPRLIDALRVSPLVPGPGKAGVRLSGDLVMLNYYNPFAHACPSSTQFIHMLNDHLARDAALFHIPIADVYTAFGGDTGMANTVCSYTWFCDDGDIHPNTTGYKVIAQAVQAVLGYPNPLPQPAAQPAPGDQSSPPAAYRRPTA